MKKWKTKYSVYSWSEMKWEQVFQYLINVLENENVVFLIKIIYFPNH